MTLERKIVKTDFKKLFEKKGYTYFDNGSYNINIIGVRANKNINKNDFCDFIVVEFLNSDGNLCQYRFHATTTPGLASLTNPVNPKGCAILVPNQYRGAFTFGRHKNKYEALVQCKPLPVSRDYNKDNVLDYNSKCESGMFGINIHKAGVNSKLVDNWSAGCQVFKTWSDFDTFMTLCHLQEQCGKGNKFTYTLIDEKDLGFD